MAQEVDVNNCFDSAFLRVVGSHPDPDKNLSTDYSLPPQQVHRILYLTSTCLSAKGYIFDPNQGIVDQCCTGTVLAALQLINENTKAKGRLPLVAAAQASLPKKRLSKSAKKVKSTKATKKKTLSKPHTAQRKHSRPRRKAP